MINWAFEQKCICHKSANWNGQIFPSLGMAWEQEMPVFYSLISSWCEKFYVHGWKSGILYSASKNLTCLYEEFYVNYKILFIKSEYEIQLWRFVRIVSSSYIQFFHFFGWPLQIKLRSRKKHKNQKTTTFLSIFECLYHIRKTDLQWSIVRSRWWTFRILYRFRGEKLICPNVKYDLWVG